MQNIVTIHSQNFQLCCTAPPYSVAFTIESTANEEEHIQIELEREK